MRYITIDNGIVSGHYATSKDTLPENGVEIAELVGVYGYPVDYYTVDNRVWQLKDRITLIREGLEQMPEGYQWNSDQTAIEPIPTPEPTPTPPTEEELKQRELDELHAYLDSTDYGVIKCMELGLIYANEYPEEHAKRQQARARINELEG